MEIWLHIFSFLPGIHIGTRTDLCLVSQRFNEIMRQNVPKCKCNWCEMDDFYIKNPWCRYAF